MNGINGMRNRGPRADMVPEIAAAVGFVSGLLRTRGCVSEQQLQVFSGALRDALTGELWATTGGAPRSWPDSSGSPRSQAPTGVPPPPLPVSLPGPGVLLSAPHEPSRTWCSFECPPCYRCLRISHGLDPLIGRAAGRVGLSLARLLRLLPGELALWVDPFEVCYRIGDHGSICVLYQASRASPAPLSCKGHHALLAPAAGPARNCVLGVSS
uniref:protein BTG2 n=1 Tax=Lonchura striata TaxID=40157 RepID=UPI00129370BC|nr:protein BTG2 [Lonchura striata domestica]